MSELVLLLRVPFQSSRSWNLCVFVCLCVCTCVCMCVCVCVCVCVCACPYMCVFVCVIRMKPDQIVPVTMSVSVNRVLSLFS